MFRSPGSVSGTLSALSVAMNRPHIPLGGVVLVTGRRFTPGARISLYEHGPFTATMGHYYGWTVADHSGVWTLPVRVRRSPDAQAEQGHR